MWSLASKANRSGPIFGRFTSRKAAFRYWVRRANTARDAKDWEEAAQLYENALAYVPGSGPVHVQCAHMHKEAGHLAKAEAHYLQALALLPGDADLQLQIGHYFKVAGKASVAADFYQRALDRSPGWSEAQRELDDLRRQSAVGGPQPASSDDGTAGTAPGQPIAREPHPDNSAAGAAILPPALPINGSRLTAAQIGASGLFDASWYRTRYPDVAQAGHDPLTHYATGGIDEWRAPGPGFEPDWYSETYLSNDPATEPFSHYMLVGRALGHKPVGPAPYPRWTEAFDLLTAQDNDQIDRHIAEAGLVAPTLLLVVDRRTAPYLRRTLRSIQAQRLRPARVLICPTPDCPADAVSLARAVVGKDPLFRFAGAAAEQPREGTDEGALVLMDASSKLREHALYMLVQACGPGVRFVYSDEDWLQADGTRAAPLFKPDASPELLRWWDYLGGCVLLASASDTADLIRDLSSGQASLTASVRAAFAAAGRTAVAHVPHVLFHDQSADRDRRMDASPASLDEGSLPTVTIILPTRDKLDLLQACIDSLWRETDYPSAKLDVVVVDNGSEEWETLDYLRRGARAGRFRVIDAPFPFNYSRMNNMAARSSDSELLVLLNNDTEIQDAGWLRCLAAYAMQPDVGAVGPKLLYEDGTIQHAGVVLNVGGLAAHAHLGLQADEPGAMGLAQVTREVSVVTGACLAIRRSVFNEIGGLDEQLPVAFNDVLLCLACLQHGYRNIYVHSVWVRHLESKSRGKDDTLDKIEVFLREGHYARRRYPDLFFADPFYSPNLSLQLDTMYEPAFPPRRSRPWQRHASATQRRRVLILSGSISSDNRIGIATLLHCRHFSSRGWDVVVGTPSADAAAELRDASHVKLLTDKMAAVYAVKHRFDLLIVHSWPFLTVATLLRSCPVTALHYGDADTAGVATTPHERFMARLQRGLGSASFELAFASSEAEMADLDRHDAVLCPTGGDVLGTWHPGLMTRRHDVRVARGWTGFTVILAAVDANRRETAVRSLSNVARHLDPARVLIAVVSRKEMNLPGLTFIGARPPGIDASNFYVAADLFLSTDPPGAASLVAAEAAAFGLPFIETIADLDKGLTAGEEQAAALHLARQIKDKALESPLLRRSSGPLWRDALAALDAEIGARLGTVPDHDAEGLENVSDRALIEWSGLFDESYYSDRYRDVSASGQDMLQHYCNDGGKEGRQPSMLFHAEWFAAQYPEIKARGVNLLAYYLRHPRADIDPNPFFSNSAYLADLARRPSLGEIGNTAPLVHYIQTGASQGLSAGAGFDPVFYCETYPDVAGTGEVPLVHFLTKGVRTGRLPVPLRFAGLDVYDPLDLARVAGHQAGPTAESGGGPEPDPELVVDVRSAARFCISLLCSRPDLRRDHPRALSAGLSGSFFAWITGDGLRELGLPPAAAKPLHTLFAEDYGAAVLQVVLTRDEPRSRFPFGLLPVGLGALVGWLLAEGRDQAGLNGDQVHWFAIATAECPQDALARTFLFSPPLQERFPDGLTVFGRDRFACWLRNTLRTDAAWLDPATWPQTLTPAEQVRVAYAARPSWQAAHPAPFASEATARSLLAWLRTVPDLPVAARDWLASLDLGALAAELAVDGLNMVAHFCYPSGLQTSAVSLVEGYRRAGGRAVCRDTWVEPREAVPRHAAFGGLEVYDTTMIHTQPEPFFNEAYGRAGLHPRVPRTHRIAYWYWELDTVPAHWQEQAEQVDEIWTATRFVGDALRERMSQPVFEMMPGLELPPVTPLPRSHFGLPDDKFLFLFTFHMMSIMERKNPLGLIRAFRQAFDGKGDVGLVLKTSYGDKHPELMAEMHEAARASNVTIIDSIYTQGEVLALMQSCDAYVSLHRSEGYGLTMAEAMLLGRPVIATGYSGNLDFMTPATSLLVDYKLATLDKAHGPYAVGTRWAEPSVQHAAECMRRVHADRNWARALGARAQADLRIRLSHDAAGKRITERLQVITQTRRSHTPKIIA